MKKIILTSLLALFSLGLTAQVTTNITVQPANPTNLSSIKIFTDMYFPSGGCSDHTQFFSVSGNTIYASALHCLGPLSFICSYTDTFDIGTLAPGNYSFIFNLNAGAGSMPCSPGIVPGPTDTLNFVVSTATAISEFTSDQPQLIYNSTLKTLQLSRFDQFRKAKLSMYSSEGKLILSKTSESVAEQIVLTGLQAGLYVAKFEWDGKVIHKKFIVE
ncbi:MAG TPA: T9SS type A sorting domain-containing protein [Bacteroidia bacterium]|nr:T9SS type A sorting domain-containing protein [Bacteroidia bacterium]